MSLMMIDKGEYESYSLQFWVEGMKLNTGLILSLYSY